MLTFIGSIEVGLKLRRIQSSGDKSFLVNAVVSRSPIELNQLEQMGRSHGSPSSRSKSNSFSQHMKSEIGSTAGNSSLMESYPQRGFDLPVDNSDEIFSCDEPGTFEPDVN